MAKETIKDVKSFEVDGYKLNVDRNMFDDVEFYRLADEVPTRQSALIDILKLGLGDKEYNKMANFFINRDGRFKMSIVSEAIDQIFELADPKESLSGESGNSTQTN